MNSATVKTVALGAAAFVVASIVVKFGQKNNIPGFV
jgi:hypothetical protein